MALIALCVLGLAQIACDEDDPEPTPRPDGRFQLPAAVRGGGWFQVEEGKATFGFQLTCDPETDLARGQFQYNDHVAGRAFHGVVEQPIVDCLVTELSYTGEYTPQPPTAGYPGTFVLELSEDSCLTITLNEGVYAGYSRSGCLEGGKLRFWLLPD
jgi:hypothetical protein